MLGQAALSNDMASNESVAFPCLSERRSSHSPAYMADLKSVFPAPPCIQYCPTTDRKTTGLPRAVAALPPHGTRRMGGGGGSNEKT